MDPIFILIQVLNGLQYGFLLFLVASGLTLVFGIMGVINLAHGAFYMVGAYLAFWLTGIVGNLFLAIILALPLAVAFGWLIERFAVSFLYERAHLDQVLLTYGLILVLNEFQRVLWGNDVHGVPVPELLAGTIQLTPSLSYPIYRLFISAIGLLLAFGMWWGLTRTHTGMVVRASVENREMAQALGININRQFAWVFSIGAALAAVAGMIAAPVEAVYPGMGDNVLIVSFVIVVIGGIGSVRGAFVGAMLIGLADAFGNTFMPDFASFMMYGLMAVVLLWRPHGLFGRSTA